MGGYGMAAQAGLSAVGEIMAQQSKERQRQLLQKVIDEFGKIDLPSLQKVIAEQEGPSAMEGISTDPESVAAQHAALDALKNVSDSGGLTLTDHANLNRIRNNSAAAASSGRQRIAEDMASRGSLDSGVTLAMQLAGNEGSANRQSQQDMDIAGEAQKRALDAIMQRGTLAGQVRGQDFSEKSRKAEAADLIARYNAEARSKAQYHNANLPQENFDNQMRRTQGQATGTAPLASYYGEQAGDQRGFWAGLGKTANDASQQLGQDGLSGQPQQGYQYAAGQTQAAQYPTSSPDEWEDPYRKKSGVY